MFIAAPHSLPLSLGPCPSLTWYPSIFSTSQVYPIPKSVVLSPECLSLLPHLYFLALPSCWGEPSNWSPVGSWPTVLSSLTIHVDRSQLGQTRSSFPCTLCAVRPGPGRQASDLELGGKSMFWCPLANLYLAEIRTHTLE